MLDVLYYLLCPVLSFSGEAEGVLKAEEKEAIVKALRYLGQDLAAFLKYREIVSKKRVSPAIPQYFFSL